MITVEKPRKISVQEIRERYPNPKTADEVCKDGDGGYCVGGALCQFIKYKWGGVNWYFPPVFVLSAALKESNPNITDAMAHLRAKRIVYQNDKGDFESAWIALDKALRCKGVKKHES